MVAGGQNGTLSLSSNLLMHLTLKIGSQGLHVATSVGRK